MSQRSLASRAAVALALTVGFYLLAIGIALGLLGAVYAELVYANEILIKPTIFAVIGAILILWSILPRFDRFTAPGPQLHADAQPELFGLIGDVAAKTEQQMPREVYLIPEVNAWVMQRGGLAGIGSRRVMGIGLALLQSVDVQQLRAILAHEFGHYHGGDTSLGPWIYKTRMAIGRTIQNLSRSSLHKPFLWYGNFFMNVTQAISRAQELAADKLAATVAGAQTTIDALTAVHRAGAAYGAYWSTEVVPVLSNGFLPPIAAGLAQFMSSSEIETQLGALMEREMAEGTADKFDSHPPLRERLAALHALGESAPAPGGARAVTLLRNLDALEAEMVRPMFVDPKQAAKLRTVRWDETTAQVYAPLWRKRVEEHAGVLRELDMVGVAGVVTSLPEFAAKLRVDAPNAEAILGCAIATRLLDDGWVCDAAPGAAVTMHKDGRVLAPFLVVPRMNRKELNGREWAEECAAAGIAERPLA